MFSIILAAALIGSPRDIANRPVKHFATKSSFVKPLLLPPLPLATMPAQTNSVTLVWNPSVGAFTYRLYQGTNSRTYDLMSEVGNVTNYTTTVESRKLTNYFAATAVASDGTESDLSNEAMLRPLAVAVPLYRYFFLQTSTNLTNWTDNPPQPIGRMTNTFGPLPQEYYRWRVLTTTNAIP